ncbi:hypothetical protein BV20DRAFT_971667 [Pilatotrama ljubarskyi]|nr:hypothetical protein BV20DRAFT_971667 [Pilatotrama ljubarskyi]
MSGASPFAWSGQWQVVKSEGAAFLYTYTQPSPATAPIELDCVSDVGKRLGGLPYGTRSSLTLGPGNPYYVRLKHVSAHTAAGAPVGQFEPGAGYAATTIFSVDPDTGKITVKWVNVDGTVTSPLYVIVYANGLFLTGDVSTSYGQTGATPEIIQVVVSAPCA